MKNSKIYPWVVVGLLWGVALLNYMDRQMLSTMRDAMAVDITELQSAANFGRLMGVFSLDIWLYEPYSRNGGRPHEPQMAYCWQFVCMVGRHLSDGNSRHL